jgi:uncharacterized protein DUF397
MVDIMNWRKSSYSGNCVEVKGPSKLAGIGFPSGYCMCLRGGCVRDRRR